MKNEFEIAISDIHTAIQLLLGLNRKNFIDVLANSDLKLEDETIIKYLRYGNPLKKSGQDIFKALEKYYEVDNKDDSNKLWNKNKEVIRDLLRLYNLNKADALDAFDDSEKNCEKELSKLFYEDIEYLFSNLQKETAYMLAKNYDFFSDIDFFEADIFASLVVLDRKKKENLLESLSNYQNDSNVKCILDKLVKDSRFVKWLKIRNKTYTKNCIGEQNLKEDSLKKIKKGFEKSRLTRALVAYLIINAILRNKELDKYSIDLWLAYKYLLSEEQRVIFVNKIKE